MSLSTNEPLLAQTSVDCSRSSWVHKGHIWFGVAPFAMLTVDRSSLSEFAGWLFGYSGTSNSVLYCFGISTHSFLFGISCIGLIIACLNKVNWGQILQAIDDVRPWFSKNQRQSSADTESLLDGCGKRRLTLTVPDCFLSKESIQMMTLKDIADVFFYGSRVNQQGFNRDDFFAKTSLRSSAKLAIHALDCAVLRSRGKDTVLFETEPGSSGDHMDALMFCGTVRMYAEWRSVRGIPEGYPKFAFGMKMGRMDLIKNLDKIETAVHKLLDDREDTMLLLQKEDNPSASERLKSPTLRQLLEHERDTNVHPNLPVVFEYSAGSGILWTKRQITYQSSTMDNNSRVPMDFPTPKAAFYAAYEAVYGRYHTFWTAAFFKSTIDSAPAPDVVKRHMNMPYAEELKRKAADIDEKKMMLPKHVNASADSDHGDESSLGVETLNSERTLVRPPEQMESFDEGDAVIDLVDKIGQMVSTFFGPCISSDDEEEISQQHHPRNLLGSHDPIETAAEISCMEKNDVPYYLSVLRPLEQSWDRLIVDLNMNDPTRG